MSLCRLCFLAIQINPSCGPTHCSHITLSLILSVATRSHGHITLSLSSLRIQWSGIVVSTPPTRDHHPTRRSGGPRRLAACAQCPAQRRGSAAYAAEEPGTPSSPPARPQLHAGRPLPSSTPASSGLGQLPLHPGLPIAAGPLPSSTPASLRAQPTAASSRSAHHHRARST